MGTPAKRDGATKKCCWRRMRRSCLHPTAGLVSIFRILAQQFHDDVAQHVGQGGSKSNGVCGHFCDDLVNQVKLVALFH